MARIDDIPPEILAHIFTVHGLTSYDLAQAARVCKAFSGEATRASYRYNIEQERASVLISAAQKGRIDWMRKALSMGADINTVGPGRGETPEDLDGYTWCDIYPDDGKYGTALHYAALQGDDDMVALLLTSGASLNVPSYGLCDCIYNVTSENPPDLAPRWLPLHHAVCREHASTANLLLDEGAPLHMYYQSEEFSVLSEEPCDSLIHWAAARGLVTLVRRAMDMGSSASALTRDCSTALHCTRWAWNSEAVIQCLLSAGAELDAQDWEGRTPLAGACAAGNFSSALHLLKAGENIQSQTERGKNTLFYEAASGGSAMILEHHRPGPVVDWDQYQVDFLRTLIEVYGMAYHDSYKSDRKATPKVSLISAACCSTHVVPGVIKLLLNNDSDPNEPSLQGEVPLQMLLGKIKPSGKWILPQNANKYRQAIYILVEHGARISRVAWDFLSRMRLWVRDRKVDRDDRNLLKYLLKKWYEEMAAEDEISADEHEEDDSEENDSEEDYSEEDVSEEVGFEEDEAEDASGEDEAGGE